MNGYVYIRSERHLWTTLAAVDTSCTPKPDCHQWPGTHAQRMPSHQHYMWTCAPRGGVS